MPRSTDWREQPDLLETEPIRSLLDRLLTDARLYRTSKDYVELLEFVARLRNIAPFNAMLLNIQKPGLRHAASANDWWVRFRRRPKDMARPLLILWPFAPVALVYDVMDTEGEELPQDVESFFARGPISDADLFEMRGLLEKKGINWFEFDAGDSQAGSIWVLHKAATRGEPSTYRMNINANHPPATRFATVAHELGHLFLGHLGPDRALNIPQRPSASHEQIEIEAESVSFIVCERNGVRSSSRRYLSGFASAKMTAYFGDRDRSFRLIVTGDFG